MPAPAGTQRTAPGAHDTFFPSRPAAFRSTTVASRTGPALPRALAAEARRQHGGHHRLLSAVLLDHEERRPALDVAAHRVRPADRVLAGAAAGLSFALALHRAAGVPGQRL